MKKLNIIILSVLISASALSQVSTTINVVTPGTLNTLLTPNEKTTVTYLTLTGNIDARDVQTMRDNMPLLEILDMGAVNIIKFTGSATNGFTTYPANEMPQNSFHYIKSNLSISKTTLTTITLPTNLISIGNSAFEYCTGLKGNLILPNSLTTLGSYAFRGCSGLTGSLTLPNSLNTIGQSAFQDCSFTGSLTLGTGLKTIAEGAFANCIGLKIINNLSISPPIIEGFFSFLSVSPVIVYVQANVLQAYKASGWARFNIIAEKRVNVNVTTAGGMAANIIGLGFGPLSTITHLTVTGNLNSIDINQMKTNMTTLTSIDLSGATIALNGLPANAFQSKILLSSVILPSNLLSIGDYAFDGCVSLDGVIPIPLSAISIGEYAYQNCKTLNGNFNLPSSLNSIYKSAFFGCIGISGNLTLPSNLVSIGSNAFDGCKSLTGNLNIPNTITFLGAYAFQGCSGFDGTLTIGSSLTKIEDGSFAGCSGLKGNITIPNSVYQIGSGAFKDCRGFTGTLTLPNSITEIQGESFFGCSQLSGKVEVPILVTWIGNSAFQGCYKITELSIGKNLNDIGDNTLNGCVNLIKISSSCTTPPKVYANTFTSVPVESCYIDVPLNASLSYQIADYWSSFYLYTENLSTNNYKILANSDLKVYSTNLQIIIEGTTVGELVNIYSINGEQIQTVKSKGERIVLLAQKNAIYLIKTENKAFKVIL